MTLLTPTATEVRIWLRSVRLHSMHVEFYLHKMQIHSTDPERPHDLVGPGNKLEWDVVRGVALQTRSPKPDFESQILPSIEIHRQQYHHRMWRPHHPTNPLLPIPEASQTDLELGAIDTICSLLEPRAYQNGIHTFEEITDLCDKQEPHKQPWMHRMIHRMRALHHPFDSDTAHLDAVYLKELPCSMYASIKRRIAEAHEEYFGAHGRFPE